MFFCTATSDTAGGSIIKTIAMGHKSRTMHKEELGVSETERRMKKRIEENARLQQRKKSAMSSSSDANSRDRASVHSSPPSKVCVRYSHSMHTCQHLLLNQTCTIVILRNFNLKKLKSIEMTLAKVK